MYIYICVCVYVCVCVCIIERILRTSFTFSLLTQIYAIRCVSRFDAPKIAHVAADDQSRRNRFPLDTRNFEPTSTVSLGTPRLRRHIMPACARRRATVRTTST
ncbi:hypothetical protein PUN28_007052 [Cardiocondyla obscurior]|uniref:Secreted protein n=1 Tax=Cardiocondyla obscurior TaxID=286306 RepID=A0AAW2G335_9HYME